MRTSQQRSDAYPHDRLLFAVICLLVYGLGCSAVGRGLAGHPDEVLFEHAMAAVEQKQFSVASVTLESLINTYPDSEYVPQARLFLQDPQISGCGSGWRTASNCWGAE